MRRPKFELNALNPFRAARRETVHPYPAPETLVAEPLAVSLKPWPRLYRDGDQLLLAWPPAWGQRGARIAIYERRDEESTPLIVVENGDRVALPLVGSSAQQHYVLHVVFHDGTEQWVPAVERILALDGVLNARDVGGYPAAHGKRVRWRTIYRTGQLTLLTPAASSALRDELGVQAIWDLRSADEVSRFPSPVPDGIAVRNLPIGTGNNRWRRLYDLLRNRDRLDEVMATAYTIHFVDEHAAAFGHLLNELAVTEGAALIHCTAGKDRTGLAVAMLLLLLGVPEPVVVADYSLSNRWYGPLVDSLAGELWPLKHLGVSRRQLQPFLTADPALLRGALRHIDAVYGGLEAYLRGPAGVQPATITALRRRLLT